MLDMTDRTLQMELADFKDNLFKALSKMADTAHRLYDKNFYTRLMVIQKLAVMTWVIADGRL